MIIADLESCRRYYALHEQMRNYSDILGIVISVVKRRAGLLFWKINFLSILMKLN